MCFCLRMSWFCLISHAYIYIYYTYYKTSIHRPTKTAMAIDPKQNKQTKGQQSNTGNLLVSCEAMKRQQKPLKPCCLGGPVSLACFPTQIP